jgi:putative ABC transport system permease protein
MKIFMFISQFLRDMRGQKLRTILTIFGIIWGTIAIVLLLGFGVGMGRQMKKNFHGLGEGLLLVWPGRTSLPYQGLNKGRVIRFREEDAFFLKQEIPTIKEISPEYARYGVELKQDKNTYTTLVRGVYPIYAGMRNVIPQMGGRFLNIQDLAQKRRVIFLGAKVKKELFKDGEAIGKHVLLNRIPFLVIGVLIEKSQNSSYGERDENTTFIPATTFSAVFGPKYINNMVIRALDSGKNKALVKQILQVMGKKYKFNPEDTDAIDSWDLMEGESLFLAITLGFNLFLGMVGAFTLIVGGIGVSNIMNVVVEERTKEIGLKMALGAKKRFVLSQFLFETLLITLIGGAIGMAVSYGILSAFPTTSIEEEIGHPTFSLGVALVTIALLGLIGFVSGFGPARRAANLNPVEALRS